LDIPWREVEDFTYSHATPSHSADAEVVEGCKYRVTVSFRRLFVVFGQREQKFEDFFLG
jgi:hypothetical protein